jgi:hypothetical protein
MITLTLGGELVGRNDNVVITLGVNDKWIAAGPALDRPVIVSARLAG